MVTGMAVKVERGCKQACRGLCRRQRREERLVWPRPTRSEGSGSIALQVHPPLDLPMDTPGEDAGVSVSRQKGLGEVY